MKKNPKLTSTEKQALTELKQELYRKFPNRIKRIILYGSRARGESEPDSDIDILVIADDENLKFSEQIGDISWNIQFKYGFKFFLSEMLYGEKSFERDKDHLFVRNVINDGIEL